MTKQEITKITIECRHGSGHPIWNITMFVNPAQHDENWSYRELVCMAAGLLREAKDLKVSDGWMISNAELMAWSANEKTNPEHRGPTLPHEFRVSLDMEQFAD
jgi:hypothetical protein